MGNLRANVRMSTLISVVFKVLIYFKLYKYQFNVSYLRYMYRWVFEPLVANGDNSMPGVSPPIRPKTGGKGIQH